MQISKNNRIELIELNWMVVKKLQSPTLSKHSTYKCKNIASEKPPLANHWRYEFMKCFLKNNQKNKQKSDLIKQRKVLNIFLLTYLDYNEDLWILGKWIPWIRLCLFGLHSICLYGFDDFSLFLRRRNWAKQIELCLLTIMNLFSTYFNIELVFSMFVGNAIFKSPCFMSTSLFLSANLSSWFIDACIVNWADRIFSSPISNLSAPFEIPKTKMLYRMKSGWSKKNWFAKLLWSIGPSFFATLNKISAVQNSGTRTNSLPAKIFENLIWSE